MTRAQLETACRREDLVRAVPAVYRAGGTPFTVRGQIRAVVAWAGPGALLSGEAAAWWWNFIESDPATIEVVLPPTRNLLAPRTLPTPVRVRRYAVPEDDHRRCRQLPVISPALSAIEGSLRLGRPDPLDRALQTMVTLPEVIRACHRMGGRWDRRTRSVSSLPPPTARRSPLSGHSPA